MVCCLGMAAILVAMQKQKLIATDTLLGIMAHSALSLGMIAVSFLDNVRIDLMSYLFGDLLAISPSDLTFIWFGVVTVSLIVYLLWQPLLSTSVNEELAFVEGTNTDLMRLILMLRVY
ncbi:zinc transport system permease protein [Vibrio cholerae]|nr:zinc transport system permease protein [Vibrio cholerae]